MMLRSRNQNLEKREALIQMNQQVIDAVVPKCSSGRVTSQFGAALSVLALCLSGCGSGGSTGSKVQVAAISQTDANGVAVTPVMSFKVGGGTYMDTVVTNDAQALGVNWSVSCGSQLAPGTPLPPGQPVDASCGTFTAVHTFTAPVPSYATSGAGIVTYYEAPIAVPSTGTVTVFASATSDPSVFSSQTFTIIGLPISVGFAPGPPSSIEVNGTAQIGALVSNDPNAGGVKWSVNCGSITCGSFSATETASVTKTTYTAPDAVPEGGSVTITATSVTDPTKFATVAVTITPAPAS